MEEIYPYIKLVVKRAIENFISQRTVFSAEKDKKRMLRVDESSEE